MITFTKSFAYDANGKAYTLFDYIGLSTDTKPTGDPAIGNGSFFMEIDTGKLFVYDGTNKIWVEQL